MTNFTYTMNPIAISLFPLHDKGDLKQWRMTYSWFVCYVGWTCDFDSTSFSHADINTYICVTSFECLIVYNVNHSFICWPSLLLQNWNIGSFGTNKKKWNTYQKKKKKIWKNETGSCWFSASESPACSLICYFLPLTIVLRLYFLQFWC